MRAYVRERWEDVCMISRARSDRPTENMGLMVVLREILRRHTCNRSFQAVAETDVKALDAHKMIEAAASTPDQAAIDLEEFKRIIRVSAA